MFFNTEVRNPDNVQKTNVFVEKVWKVQYTTKKNKVFCSDSLHLNHQHMCRAAKQEANTEGPHVEMAGGMISVCPTREFPHLS